MKNTFMVFKYVFMSLAALLIASPAFAQGTATGGFNSVPLAAGLGMIYAKVIRRNFGLFLLAFVVYPLNAQGWKEMSRGTAFES